MWYSTPIRTVVGINEVIPEQLAQNMSVPVKNAVRIELTYKARIEWDSKWVTKVNRM